VKTADEKITVLESDMQTLNEDIERLKEIEKYTYKLKSEFEEFKKIALKEKKRAADYAIESLLGKLIPQMSNFERALKYMKMGENRSKEVIMIVKGVEMIYQSLETSLEDEGLKRIQVKIGELFNPFENDIAHQIESDKYSEHKVIEVVEEGYKYKDKILKPAMVNVSVLPKVIDKSKVDEIAVEVTKEEKKID